jgi:glyoxylase-like metal-dependent hydrolase (beta-lactamase superfamily II)
MVLVRAIQPWKRCERDRANPPAGETALTTSTTSTTETQESAMNIETFFDPATFTLTYVVFDPKSRDAIVIDPVLDYDPLGSTTSTRSLETVEAFVKKEDLKLHYVLETHAHADHLSGSQYLKRRFGAAIAIGAPIVEVQQVFKDVFDLGPSFSADGSQFDRLLSHGEQLSAGTMKIEVIGTPGHTPACVTYKIEDAVFTGDALFIEDYGTGRCDFPRGSADALYTSVHERLYRLPDATRVFVGHDYQPNGRAMRAETTIGRSKEQNIQLRASTTREQFVQMRNDRDAKLSAPRLLFPSVQVNIDAGRLPAARANGRRYLTIPLDLKKKTYDDGTPV